jgi:hypothetical protein
MKSDGISFSRAPIEDGFHCDQVNVEANNQGEAVVGRMMIMTALVDYRPIVIHDTDDELAMTKLCETLWPGPCITRIRQNIETERPGLNRENTIEGAALCGSRGGTPRSP